MSVTQATAPDKTRSLIAVRCRRGAGDAPYPATLATLGNRCNRGMTTPSGARDYGLAPALRARLMGIFLGGVGVVLLLGTLAVAFLRLSNDVVAVLVILVLVGIAVLSGLLSRRWFVVRLDEVGYQVRFVRGVGRPQARWIDVEDLTTGVYGGTECVVLRLRDGRTSTIPVNLIEGDREEFVDELKRRLNTGHGYRPR